MFELARWFKSFLDNRGGYDKVMQDFIQPGLPLYKYRITKDEYNELKTALKTHIAVNTQKGKENINNMFEKDTNFQRCFVLFMAEWWRREYDRGQWGYKSAYEILGLTIEPTRPALEECISRGLSCFNRSLVGENGNRKEFLGSLFLNGGLPADYIARFGQSNIVVVIKKGLKYAIDIGDSKRLYEYIQMLMELYGPKAFRDQDIYRLICEIVQIVIGYKEKYNLNDGAKATRILDKEVPNWKNSFPLLIESNAVDALITDIVKTAAMTKQEFNPYIRMVLTPEKNDKYVIKSKVEFPDKISREYLPYYFRYDAEKEMHNLVNVLDSNGICVAKFVDDIWDGDLLTRTESNWFSEGIIENICLSLMVADGAIDNAELNLGKNINTDAPLVFKPNDDTDDLEYVGWGSVSVRNEYCFVAVKQDSDYAKKLQDLVGTTVINSQTFCIYKISENIQLDGYQIKVNDEDAYYNYELSGNLLEYRSRPYEIYKGMPDLYVEDMEHRIRQLENVEYRYHDSQEKIRDKNNFIGIVDIYGFNESNQNVCKISCAVISKEAKISYDKNTITESGGDIIFENFPNIICDDNGYTVNKTWSDNKNIFNVIRRDDFVKGTVKFKLQFNDKSVSMDIPCPRSGVVFSLENENINSKDVLFGDLTEARMQVFSTDKLIEITISNPEEATQRVKQLYVKKNFINYDLQDIKKDVKFLFRKKIDSQIKISVNLNSKYYYLFVHLYDFALTICDESQLVLMNWEQNQKITQIPDAKIWAVNVFDKNYTKKYLEFTSDATVDLHCLDEGLYIISSDKNTKIKPVMYTNTTDPQKRDLYEKLISASPMELSNFLYQKLIQENDAGVLDVIKTITMACVDKNNDIRLNYTNLWSCIVNDMELLCYCLVFLDFDIIPLETLLNMDVDIIDKLQISNEDVLIYRLKNDFVIHPETIPVYVWIQMLDSYRQYIKTKIKDATDIKIDKILKRKFKRITEQYAYLQSLLFYILHNQEIQDIKQGNIGLQDISPELRPITHLNPEKLNAKIFGDNENKGYVQNLAQYWATEGYLKPSEKFDLDSVFKNYIDMAQYEECKQLCFSICGDNASEYRKMQDRIKNFPGKIAIYSFCATKIVENNELSDIISEYLDNYDKDYFEQAYSATVQILYFIHNKRNQYGKQVVFKFD